jgi:hypothetical protein
MLFSNAHFSYVRVYTTETGTRCAFDGSAHVVGAGGHRYLYFTWMAT